MQEKAAMALMRATGPQRSASTPGALVNGAETKVPARNRPTSRLAKLRANAQRKVKAMYMRKVMKKMYRLP